MGNRFNLKSYEVNTALEFFMHHMPMEQRHQLMTEFPEIYNKLVNKTIVTSVKVNQEKNND
jgi:hypothetical protein